MNSDRSIVVPDRLCRTGRGYEHFADSMIGAYDVSEGCLYSTAPVPRRPSCPSRFL
jgi:hypothetical protein